MCKIKVKTLKITFGIILLSVSIWSCKKSIETVEIGNQRWMVKNLNLSHFRNGDSIIEVKTNEELKKAGDNGQPAWCYYDYDPSNGVKYGKLYNWYAVNDSRGLAPEGRHIPSNDEWWDFEEYLGSEPGAKMKSSSGWRDNSNSTNESGFSALPGGYGGFGGKFHGIDSLGYWWSSVEYRYETSNAWLRGTGDKSVLIWDLRYDKYYMLSVRCLKD